MCTRPAPCQGIGPRYPGFIADLFGDLEGEICWLFFPWMSTTGTGPPIPDDGGHGV